MTAGLSLQAIHIYPVKAMHGLSLAAAHVEPWGLADDRRWMVVHPHGGFVTQRELPAMARIAAQATPLGLTLATPGHAPLLVTRPADERGRLPVRVWRDTVPALDAGDDAAAWLAAVLGIVCRLVYLDDPTVRPVDPAFANPDDRAAFSDGFPLLLTTSASLDRLNSALAEPIPMSRFRPNIVIAGAGAWAEDRWRRIRVGAVTFRIVKPCARCVVTTVDQESGERPDRTEPLKTLARLRRTAEGVIFGQNLIPDSPGAIALGDRVEVLEDGESNVRLEAPQGETA